MSSIEQKEKSTPQKHWTDGLWGKQIREAEMERKDSQTTPRPWRWLPREGQFIVGPDEQIVAEVPCQGCNPADGELIVTAVNERDQLLSSLAEKQGEIQKLKALLSRLALAKNCWCPLGHWWTSSGTHSVRCVEIKAALNPISEPQEQES